MMMALHNPSRIYKGNREVLQMSKSQLMEFRHLKGKGGGGGSPVKFRKREGGLGDI